MCLFNAPRVPSVAAPVQNPTEQDAAIRGMLEAERRRRAVAAGLSATIKTGPQGLTAPATTSAKRLFGE